VGTLLLLHARDQSENSTGLPPTGVQIADGLGKIALYSTSQGSVTQDGLTENAELGVQ